MKKNQLPSSVLENIRDSFENRDYIVVQNGGCNRATGSDEYLKRVLERYGKRFTVLEGGCDGACFLSPRAYWTGSDHKDELERNLWNLNADPDLDFENMNKELTSYLLPQKRIVMKDIGLSGWSDLGQYLSNGGFYSFSEVLQLSPDIVTETVAESGLKGRGGAYFSVGMKWKSAQSFAQDGKNTEIIINAEEGEPGVYKDRHLMEGMPFRIIEGALITAYANSASSIHIYVNAEAKLSFERMTYALSLCEKYNLIGRNILGSGFDANIKLLRGAGGYVCGEESTLINTIEGDRREPRLRPPFPTQSGLHNLPTVVNNVETVCSLPYIMSGDKDAFRTIGSAENSGTKIVSLSGSLKRSGVAEVPMGTSIKYILETVSGTDIEENLVGAAVGGPSSGILPNEKLNLLIEPGFIDGKYVMVGAGGIVGIDKDVDPLQIVRILSSYNSRESCGKCTPCREGTPRIREMLGQYVKGKSSTKLTHDLNKLSRTVNAASLCGLGQSAGNPVLSYLEYFENGVK